MSVFIPGEQHQAVLLVGEPLEDGARFQNLGSVFIANGYGTVELRIRINLARSAFSRLQSCLWLRRQISLCTKPLAVLDNDSIHRILHVRRRDCVPAVGMRINTSKTKRCQFSSLVSSTKPSCLLVSHWRTMTGPRVSATHDGEMTG